MTAHTTISVRGEARRTVAPDFVVLQVELRAVPAPRAEVLSHDFDEATGRHGLTGRVQASTSAVVTVRRLDRLGALGEALAVVDHLAISDVRWQVDPDNPAWPVVRADAIAAALAKARDYAAALGGSVVDVEHVADAGLLTGTQQRVDGGLVMEHAHQYRAAAAADGGIPTLDPVPQQIRATVEARVVAAVGGR